MRCTACLSQTLEAFAFGVLSLSLHFLQDTHNRPDARQDYERKVPCMQDGVFTFSEMECMGSCVNAPMIAIADYTKGVAGFSYDYYEDLSPADAVKILDDLKAGKAPEVGLDVYV